VDGRAIALAIPFFLALIALEMQADKRRRRRGEEPLYRFADSITSLACGVGQQVLSTLVVATIQIGAYTLVYERLRLFTIPERSIAGWIFAFVGVDLAYYAYHRASHRINFFWATHVVHHQSEEYNLSTALRQSWFTSLTSWIFYAPLALVGVPPLVYVMCLTLNTLYQFWIHTRTIGKLGFVERLMNTPSHHRVHHGIDPEYIDKNYAGVFIVWDKLFGSFVEERREPAYGTVKPLASFDSFWANVEGYARLVDMTRRTARLRDKLGVWIAPPEWRPADLGGPVEIPEVDHEARRKHDVPKNRTLFRYVGAQFVAVAATVFSLLWFEASLAFGEKAALVAVVLVTLAGWGALLERRGWALPLELARLGALGAALVWIAAARGFAPPVAVVWAAYALGCAIWLVLGMRRDGGRAPLSPEPARDTARS
jgi:sterol desaturase/sphingolipid hydroxylase (fatty acid hydroxylase superfamily)